jgi:hypothetical protein
MAPALDQTESGVKRALPDKLSIHRHARGVSQLFNKPFERLRGINHREVISHNVTLSGAGRSRSREDNQNPEFRIQNSGFRMKYEF